MDADTQARIRRPRALINVRSLGSSGTGMGWLPGMLAIGADGSAGRKRCTGRGRSGEGGRIQCG